MSEYQYYEFQAVDRPLSEKEKAELRAISTRAVITATSFTNTYHWGDLKADPRQLLRKYFDAFLYVANWGTHWLAFRVPADAVDSHTLKAYQTPQSFAVRRRGSHVVLDFCSEEEAESWVDGDGRLASLVSLRADILHGDFRAPYLAWLLDVQRGLVEAGAGPPVPPGLAELSAPLKSLADFLRLDGDLLGAAAEAGAVSANTYAITAVRHMRFTTLCPRRGRMNWRSARDRASPASWRSCRGTRERRPRYFAAGGGGSVTAWRRSITGAVRVFGGTVQPCLRKAASSGSGIWRTSSSPR